jgi:hypothetical protein
MWQYSSTVSERGAVTVAMAFIMSVSAARGHVHFRSTGLAACPTF